MKCCICGTVRNCGIYLCNIFKIMEKIGSLFEDYRIILYYDSSSDNTLVNLENYSKINDKMIYIVNQDPILKYRTHRIAKGRNKCLQTMRNDFSDYEYFIMMDCDDKCNYKINLNMLSNFLNINDWDALSFNHPSGYYDSWALSKRPFVLNCHCYKDPNLGKKYITELISKTPPNKLIRCFSAFNGFSVYRTNKFNDCWYNGYFNLNYWSQNLIKENIIAAGPILYKGIKYEHEDCEHRYFHFSAVKKHNARIMISPLCLFS